MELVIPCDSTQEIGIIFSSWLNIYSYKTKILRNAFPYKHKIFSYMLNIQYIVLKNVLINIVGLNKITLWLYKMW